MTLLELKQTLHKKIDSSEDSSFLKQIDYIFEQKQEMFAIPKDHLAGIEQGMRDIENGDFITLNELKQRYDQWLSV